jgi:membrane associated rhomboid family serine protease
MYSQKLPPAIKNLLIINGLFFLAKWAINYRFQIDITDHLGLFDPSSSYFRPWQFITHFFMHADDWHLISNMLFFFIFGPELEVYFGTKRFVIFYFVTALGAAALYLAVNHPAIAAAQEYLLAFKSNPTTEGYELFKGHLKGYQEFTITLNDHSEYTPATFLEYWQNNSNNPSLKKIALDHSTAYVEMMTNIPMVGASGAIFGLMFAFGYLFPERKILFYPAWLVVFFFGAMEFYRTYTSTPDDNIAHVAHLGGMLFAYLLILLWKANRRKHIF